MSCGNASSPACSSRAQPASASARDNKVFAGTKRKRKAPVKEECADPDEEEEEEQEEEEQEEEGPPPGGRRARGAQFKVANAELAAARGQFKAVSGPAALEDALTIGYRVDAFLRGLAGATGVPFNPPLPLTTPGEQRATDITTFLVILGREAAKDALKGTAVRALALPILQQGFAAYAKVDMAAQDSMLFLPPELITSEVYNGLFQLSVIPTLTDIYGNTEAVAMGAFEEGGAPPPPTTRMEGDGRRPLWRWQGAVGGRWRWCLAVMQLAHPGPWPP
jgi:hypothetical protein